MYMFAYKAWLLALFRSIHEIPYYIEVGRSNKAHIMTKVASTA